MIKSLPKYHLILTSFIILTCYSINNDIKVTQRKGAHEFQKEEAEKRGLKGMSGISMVKTGLDVLVEKLPNFVSQS